MIKGVITNDTWGGRFANDLLVDTPILALEWILMHQNLTLEQYGWITTDFINKTKFDVLYLTELHTDLKIARQLLTENEMSTDYLIKSLCKEFFMLHYQDSDGKECVDYLFKDRTPQFSITLADTFDVSEITQLTKGQIYCEPVINYAYDYATEKYTKSARVTNVSAASWQASYTPGFTSAHGEELWTKCHNLYLRYGHIEPMPEDLQNKKWICRYEDAYWWLSKFYGIEETGCQDWSRISVDLGYYDCIYTKQIDIGMIGSLNIPSRTGGSDYQVMVEGITPNKESKICTLDLIILTQTYEYPMSSIEMWQDNDDTGEMVQANDDTGEIVQEN